MGILDVSNEPKVPSLDEVVNGLKNINKQMYDNIKAGHEAAFKAVWNNNFYSAKEIIGAFGADAVRLFQLSSALQSILKSVNAEYEMLAPNCPVEITADGQVNVGDPIPQPEPIIEEPIQ